EHVHGQVVFASDAMENWLYSVRWIAKERLTGARQAEVRDTHCLILIADERASRGLADRLKTRGITCHVAEPHPASVMEAVQALAETRRRLWVVTERVQPVGLSSGPLA